MAEIATFKCSNQQCRLTLRLAHNFPVWDQARKHITRYRSETFCTTCNKVVEYTGDKVCAVCTTEVETENLGRACTRCNSGSFTMPHLALV